MPRGLPLSRRETRASVKRITFDGVTYGAVGALQIFNVVGAVLIEHLAVRCVTLLTGSGTVELGVAGNTAGLIAQTTGTDIDAGEFWQDATPELGVSPAIVDKAVVGDINLTIGTNTITAGVLEFTVYWKPLSKDGNLD